MAGNVKLMTSAGGGVILDTATTTATDVTVKVPVTGVNNGTLVCSDSSGNVGIGTSSPAAQLHVKTGATTSPVLRLETGAANDYGANIQFADTGGVEGSIDYSFYYKYLAFSTNSFERMRIDSSGNLLVGTTSQTNSERAGIVAEGNVFLVKATGGGNTARLTYVNGNAIIDYFVNTANSVNVGTIAVSGSTGTSYNTTSDYRLKENIQPMQNALDVVAQLNPVTYTWKADGSDGQGFIAHELQAVVPDCVTGEKDAVDAEGKPVYQGIDTSFLVATLTKAIQELKEQVDAQAAEIAALKGAA